MSLVIPDVVSLLNYDGDFTESIGSHIVTNSGATINTTTKKLGSGSGDYDTVDDYTKLSNGGDLNLTEFSISSWLQPSSIGLRAAITYKGGLSLQNQDISYLFERNSDNKLRLIIGDGGSTLQVASSIGTITSTSDFTQVGVKIDGTNITFYIQGEPSGIITQTKIPQITAEDISIGGLFGDRPQSGLIDQHLIVGRDITDAEFAGIYNSGAGIGISSGIWIPNSFKRTRGISYMSENNTVNRLRRIN